MTDLSDKTQKVPPLPPIVPPCNSGKGEQQKPDFCDSKDLFLSLVPPCSPINVVKEAIEIKKRDWGDYKEKLWKYKENSTEKYAYRRLDRTKGGTGEQILPENLKVAVRKVLNFLDIETNYGNFHKYNSMIDWQAFSKWINHPTRTALYYLENRRGMRVEVMGTPVVCAEDIPVCTEYQAREILDRDNKIFVRWW